MEELLTAATTGILRHIAAEEVSKEKERKEEERRQAEEERWVCLVPAVRLRLERVDKGQSSPGLGCSYRCPLHQHGTHGSPSVLIRCSPRSGWGSWGHTHLVSSSSPPSWLRVRVVVRGAGVWVTLSPVWWDERSGPASLGGTTQILTCQAAGCADTLYS